MSESGVPGVAVEELESDAPQISARRSMVLNMGPQHPSTHGVLRLLMELDGETIVTCKPDIGYLHTGIEKEFEAKNYQQAVTLTDRVDYLAPLSNNLGYCLAVEKLLGAGNSAAGAVDARDADGVHAPEQPLGLAGNARYRYRRDVACSCIASASGKRFCASSRCSRDSA